MKYSALKGVHDILPPEIFLWQKIEALSKELFSIFGFQEIRTPIIETTDIFIRGIGETTDIVEKEMYTFPDKAGRSITLRPEGTAPVVRSYVENHLYTLPAPQKFFYMGPMFRYERPQKGRFRQFHQISAEVFGASSAEADAEIISMLRMLLEKLGLKAVNFEINSIGCKTCRPAYKTALLAFLSGKLEAFCPDCKRRHEFNPMRILDCKVDGCIELREGSPVVTDYLCEDCRNHFIEVQSLLKLLEIPHIVNPNMVRGLDYYTRTAFEVTSEHLGAQKAVAAGGRYDRLVEEFGGPDTPAVGFAIGMERLAALVRETFSEAPPAPKVFIATLGRKAVIKSLKLADELRKTGIWAEINYADSSLKSQMRKADRLKAEYVIMIGEDELKSGVLKWKAMKDGSQGEIKIQDIGKFLSEPS